MSPKPQSAQASRTTARRTPNDVAALGVELLRAVREHEFRSRRAGGAAAASVDRAFRAWQADLERHGELDWVVDERGVRAADAATPAGRGRLDELARRLRERRVAGLRVTPELDAPTWRALVSLLAAEPGEVLRHGDAAGFLPEGCTGLELRSGAERSGDEAEKPPDETPGPPVAAERTATAGTQAAVGTGATAPDGDEAAARGPAEPDAWAARLDACADDGAYAAVVREAVRAAAEASDAGDTDSCHGVMAVLSGQAEARGRRGAPTPERRALARDGLRELATGRRLSELLARAGGDEREDGLQASRILVQLAEEAAPALISAIDAQEGERREQLLGLAVALGRTATPALRRAMEGSSPRRARIAARLAGEVQDARAVPTLARLLEHEDAEVRSEAARALARVGDERALDALEAGLESPHEDVSSMCAWCLGATGRAEAARALTGALQRARRARRLHLASAVIRSLGRLGHEDPVPELRRILARRSLFRRRELHDLKLQALDALAKLPGEEAREALEEVAAGADMSLAVAARRAAKQRAEGGEEA